jgi:hypothetical protein
MKKTLFCGMALLLASPSWGQALARDPDYELLKSVGVEPNGPALLKFFRDRTADTDPRELAKLIRQLGDDSYQVRENSQKELVRIGIPTLAAFKLVEADADPEIRWRVEKIKRQVVAKSEPAVEAAAARLIGAIRPPDAAEVLLNFLPLAADEYVADELCAAIKSTAIRKGESDPIVMKALSDPQPCKRIAAAEALSADKDQLPHIRKLLQDSSPQVRLRVALALVTLKEKEALPVLVELLGILGSDQVWQVEDLLLGLAGTDAPVVPLGNSEDTRKKCRDAWRTWLAANSDKIDLGKIGETKILRGHTLIVQQTLTRVVNGKQMLAVGEVMELDKDKKVLWKFEVLHKTNNRSAAYPVDAQILRQDRVLVAEYQNQRVTERDFTGKILWEQNIVPPGNPLAVQGMPNGNVFVVMQNRLVEFDRNHQEVFNLNRPNQNIFRARKLPNGEIVFINNQGQVTRMDAGQRVLKSFNVGIIPALFGSIDILRNGGLLVPEYQQKRAVEYSADGKIVNQFPMEQPNSVMRLANGHTLVSSQSTRRVAEFDTRGQEVWSYTTDAMIFNARKR